MCRNSSHKDKFVICIVIVCVFLSVLYIFKRSPYMSNNKAPSEEINKTIYSDKNVELTVLSIQNSKSLKFSVSNNSNNDVSFIISSVAINHFTSGNGWFSKIAAGKSAIGNYDINDSLKYNNSEQIYTIEMYIKITGNENISKVVSLELSENPNSVFFTTDKPIYSNSQMDVFMLNKAADSSVDIICHNKTKQTVSVGFADFYANDILINSYQSGKFVLPGAYIKYTLPKDLLFSNQSLEEAGINHIDKLSGKIAFFNVDSSEINKDTLIKTDEIIFFD